VAKGYVKGRPRTRNVTERYGASASPANPPLTATSGKLRGARSTCAISGRGWNLASWSDSNADAGRTNSNSGKEADACTSEARKSVARSVHERGEEERRAERASPAGASAGDPRTGGPCPTEASA
jgi:hypothetical protein